MIGIPLASLIGGVATPAGSSINILGIEFIEKFGGVRVPFLHWMAIGVPMAVILTPLAWWVIARCFRPSARRSATSARSAASTRRWDRSSTAEWKLIALPRHDARAVDREHLGPALDVTLVALCGSIAMFLPGIGLLEWKQVERGTGWDTLLMIAGVSSIGVASVETGLAKWIVEAVDGRPRALAAALVGWRRSAPSPWWFIWCSRSGR